MGTLTEKVGALRHAPEKHLDSSPARRHRYPTVAGCYPLVADFPNRYNRKGYRPTSPGAVELCVGQVAGEWYG